MLLQDAQDVVTGGHEGGNANGEQGVQVFAAQVAGAMPEQLGKFGMCGMGDKTELQGGRGDGERLFGMDE